MVVGMWVTPVVEEVWEAAGTHLADTYIGRIKGTMAQLVALRPILEIYARKKGFEGGRSHIRNALWNEEAPETQFKVTLEDILREAKRRRQRERDTQ